MKNPLCARHLHHTVDGWYLGPAFNHYRCFRVWAGSTSSEGIADMLSWFPSQVSMPTASLDDLALAALRDLTHAINNPSSVSALSPLVNNNHAALLQLTQIFLGTATTTDTVTIPPATAAMPPVPATAPRVPTAPVPPETSAALPRVESTPTPAMPPPKAVTLASQGRCRSHHHIHRRHPKSRPTPMPKSQKSGTAQETRGPTPQLHAPVDTTNNHKHGTSSKSGVNPAKHQAHAVVTVVQELLGDNSRKFSETSLGFSGLRAIYFM
jgi:hypothetical protein